MAVGLIVLLGYFVDIPVLVSLRTIFLRWAVMLAAIALVVGIVNLLTVHWGKIVSDKPGGFYSTILIISFILTLTVTAIFSPTGSWTLWIYNNVQVPVETSLMALLAVILVLAGTRVLSRRINILSLVFIFTALLVLIGTATLPLFELPVLNDIRVWIERVPAVAGSRGILLGVALGTIATGLRVLIGADRPYGG
jgi:hypothetical protein